MLRIGVLRETKASENRVALVPEVIRALIRKEKAQIRVEKGAGALAGFFDAEMEKAGALLVNDPKEVCQGSDVILKVNGPIKRPCGLDEIELLSQGKVLIGLLDPYFKIEEMSRLVQKGISAFALELLPRTSRAQAMDVLSSQGNLAGYMAVILAASRLCKIMPMLMTAAGTISPAKVLVVGAGVAGLQAIATAKRLGAVTYAYDVRPQVKEQVESLGGKFVELALSESAEGAGGYAKALSEEAQRDQRAKLTAFAAQMDIVITTAQIPGHKAPLLLESSLFDVIKPGAVVVDLACATGGNVVGAVPGEWMKIGRAQVFGADNLASLLSTDASAAFAKNVASFLSLIVKDGVLSLNFADDIVQGACVSHQGQCMNAQIAQRIASITKAR